jgi:hypothetical protein
LLFIPLCFMAYFSNSLLKFILYKLGEQIYCLIAFVGGKNYSEWNCMTELRGEESYEFRVIGFGVIELYNYRY